MTMKLVLAEPRYLKDSISIIADLVNEARFTITKDAVELIAMDPANVAMVIFKLLSSSFVEYHVEKTVEIGVNMNNLKQILRRSKSNETLCLEVTQDNKLQIQFKGTTTRTFAIPIIELDEKPQKVPPLSFPVMVSMSASLLNDSIEDADIVAESVTFMAEKDRFTVKAEGDLSRAMVEIPADEKTKISHTTGEKIKAKYSVEYLKKMITGAKIVDHVDVQFNADYPLKLEYKEIDKVMLSFILAPRMDEN
ncbi:proliferating cell nuclear antigen (pcna) [Candidatus Woesearchaeota archaeon]|nr:proliferating cell nuclear antigen (pcna) [Candidatus Woesearchaeota archaeon]